MSHEKTEESSYNHKSLKTRERPMTTKLTNFQKITMRNSASLRNFNNLQPSISSPTF